MNKAISQTNVGLVIQYATMTMDRDLAVTLAYILSMQKTRINELRKHLERFKVHRINEKLVMLSRLGIIKMSGDIVELSDDVRKLVIKNKKLFRTVIDALNGLSLLCETPWDTGNPPSLP